MEIMVVQFHCKVTKQQTDSVLVILCHEILGRCTQQPTKKLTEGYVPFQGQLPQFCSKDDSKTHTNRAHGVNLLNDLVLTMT